MWRFRSAWKRSIVGALAIVALGLAPLTVPVLAISTPALMRSPQFADLQRAIAVQSAQAYIAAAGLHELGEALAETGQIDPAAIGTVRNVRTVAELVPWPEELVPPQQQLVSALTTLEAALIGNQLAEAQAAAETVHAAEHDLSEAALAWLTAGGTT